MTHKRQMTVYHLFQQVSLPANCFQEIIDSLFPFFLRAQTQESRQMLHATP